MHYFIDGYNLLFRLMMPRATLKEKRQSIISQLNEKISFVKLDVSIVFDAIYQPDEETRTHFDRLEIYFTAQGESADDFIINFLRAQSHPSHQVVVTSDRELASRARSCGAKTEEPSLFLDKLERAYRNKVSGAKKDKKQRDKGVKEKPYSKVKIKKPPDATTPEHSADYYLDIFEEKWRTLVEEEEILSLEKQEKKPLRRKPRKPLSLFLKKEEEEPQASNETERWLKIFEKKITAPLDDL